MTRIGGGSKPPSTPPTQATEQAGQKAQAKEGPAAQKSDAAAKPSDHFEAVRPSLASRLQSLQGYPYNHQCSHWSCHHHKYHIHLLHYYH